MRRTRKRGAKYDRRLWQAAVEIAKQYSRQAEEASPVTLPLASWEYCQRAFQRSRRAELMGWHLAAEVCRQRYRHAAEQLALQLNRQTGDAVRENPLATRRSVVEELLALKREFPAVEFDTKEKRLSATTESIELEGISLGCFEISLDWTQLPSQIPSYRVIATEPHPAEHNSECTHPHVSDELLCEGEGHHLIRAAIAEGRLCDFFLIVRQVLRSYNPESAYIALDNWYGLNCVDCSYTTSDDHRCDCQRCEAVLCSECCRCCNSCDRGCCYDCCDDCRGCSETFCHGCWKSCDDCEASFCESCLEEGKCYECQEKCSAKAADSEEAYREANKAEDRQPASPTAAIHPVRVGQATHTT